MSSFMLRIGSDLIDIFKSFDPKNDQWIDMNIVLQVNERRITLVSLTCLMNGNDL